jgi:hypothetical protein
MVKWKAKKVAADAAQNIQVDAGLLLNRFDVTNPEEPADADIICATTGDFAITCTPEVEDFSADVNNAPTNTKEGKRITGWTCGLTVNCLEIKQATLELALGASKINANGGITPRDQYELADFKPVYWAGDMVDSDKILIVAMDNTVSTGGISFTATNNGKGQLALSLTPHTSLADTTIIPMAFYILEKVDGDAPDYTYTAVSPVGTENPKEEGWFILRGDDYVLTTDTAVDTNKTYYERTEGV